MRDHGSKNKYGGAREAQWSTVEHSGAHRSTLEHSEAQWITVEHSEAQCSMQHSEVQWSTGQGEVQSKSEGIKLSTVRHNRDNAGLTRC